ncbi:(4Fe-4S)-binding protein [Candidatus Thorarchaeota archaeon]|nr:MAG: (4Fe-4S)-binding protein [Candidatus Thorarchaeota archaeon]
MIITVASGKGGTGKTTVAVNLALSLEGARLFDCDVEEPNAHTLLRLGKLESQPVKMPTPLVDKNKCTLCGKCAEFCQFNALFVGKDRVLVYPEMCHSCGGCSIVCPEGAIEEQPREVGTIFSGEANGLPLVFGELNIGEPIATSVIKAVKRRMQHSEINIVDAPPGTACPVIETMQESDYLLLVTEPTPFGLHDLEMAANVVKELGIPHGVVVNRAGIGDSSAREFCEERSIPLVMEIPFDRRIAELYSIGTPFVEEMPEWKEKFQRLYAQIEEDANDGQ